jgi:hypothetical protein
VLKVQKPALGQGRPDTPGTATNLASALHEQGQFAAVVAMYCETLEVQAQVLGPEHPDRAENGHDAREYAAHAMAARCGNGAVPRGSRGAVADARP